MVVYVIINIIYIASCIRNINRPKTVLDPVRHTGLDITSISLDNASSTIIPWVLPVSWADSHLSVKFEYQSLVINF